MPHRLTGIGAKALSVGKGCEGLRAQNFLIPLWVCTHCCGSLHVLLKRGKGSEGTQPG